MSQMSQDLFGKLEINLTVNLLRSIYDEARNSIDESQVTHKKLREILGKIELTAQNFDSLMEKLRTVRSEFSQTVHSELHALSIRDQINALMKDELPGTSFDETLFAHEDLLLLMILAILCNYTGEEEVSDSSEKDSVEGNPPDVRAYTLILLMKFFRGAHRGKAYYSAKWAKIVSEEHGVQLLPDRTAQQKGYSQGWQRNGSVERAAQDYKDLIFHVSPLHWVAHKILAFEVVCSDKRYRPLALAIRIQQANAQMMLMEKTMILDTNDRLLGKIILPFAIASDQTLEINLQEWNLYRSQIEKTVSWLEGKSSDSPAQKRVRSHTYLLRK